LVSNVFLIGVASRNQKPRPRKTPRQKTLTAIVARARAASTLRTAAAPLGDEMCKTRAPFATCAATVAAITFVLGDGEIAVEKM
jgi:hypothetical protein